MSDIAIRVENLGKRYKLGERVRYSTLRDLISHTLRSSLSRLAGPGEEGGAGHAAKERTASGSFWALKDVGFEVKQGEVLGIIGRNGAGKSTLLKILSRITLPTTGVAEIYGRVGSLLEVGTGFHPELTGRENIYLNGIILGMTKNEVDQKFNDIVAFAEVEAFLDTPVKRYSSGMYVRLAFAVAAHLEPEILIVDEVLAVGDAAFQKKCLGKMGDVAKQGRTVLFVSHNLTAVEALCNKCLLLQNGQLTAMGQSREIISQYLMADAEPNLGSKILTQHPRREVTSLPLMQGVTVLNQEGAAVSILQMGQPFAVQVSFKSPHKALRPVLGVSFKTVQGTKIFTVNNKFIPNYAFDTLLTEGLITCSFDRVPLMPGTYLLDLYFGDPQEDFDIILEAISLEIVAADVFGSGRLPSPSAGPIYWPASFSLQPVEQQLSVV